MLAESVTVEFAESPNVGETPFCNVASNWCERLTNDFIRKSIVFRHILYRVTFLRRANTLTINIMQLVSLVFELALIAFYSFKLNFD